MRWYAIHIWGAPGSFPSIPGASISGAQWDSCINTQNDPGAQQVEMQIEEMTHAPIPTPDSTITIHGVSWEQIRDSRLLVGLPVEVYGGMNKYHGLPLALIQARDSLPGLLMQGKIRKAWGNWVGTEMSITLQFVPSGLTVDASGGAAGVQGLPGSPSGPTVNPPSGAPQSYNRTGPRSLDRRVMARGIGGIASPTVVVPTIPQLFGGVAQTNMATAFAAASASIGGMFTSMFGGGTGGFGLVQPMNLVHNLQPNQWLGSAIQETMSRAFPHSKLNLQISPNLKLGNQDAGVYQNMEQYAHYIQKLSNSILGTSNYLGIRFTSHDNTNDVWDGTVPLGSGVISYLDLVGQPTWIDPTTISVKCVMRSDLHNGMQLTLPPGILVTLNEGSQIPGASVQRTNIAVTGSFTILKVMHIGDFRNPDGGGWTTNYEAIIPGTGDQNATSQ
jgi:hypothetical protein